jgi:predicted nucleic acid-binding protein
VILDTDVLSAIVSPRCPARVAQELERAEEPIHTTAVNWAEICYGLARHPAGDRLRERYDRMVLPALEILAFDGACAEEYGRLRARLEQEGQRLGEADLMIAAIALEHSLTLVSGNVRHFARVPGLGIVNWFAPEK